MKAETALDVFVDRFSSRYGHHFKWPARPRKKQNVKVGTRNLVDINHAFVKCGLKFWLAFGTALQVFRDGKLAEYDWDTDVAIFQKDCDKLFPATDLLLKCGFQPVRCCNSCISYARNGEYTDVYYFKPGMDDNMYACTGYRSERRFFDNLKGIEFAGEIFLIPKDIEHYLWSLYGDDWRTPIWGKHA